tara:strand:+ start:703 stop:915 length:213 start_codon:yes stop_codon:yes gene_type:complete
MKITDKPGRYFALFFIGPFLINTSYKIKEYSELTIESYLLCKLGIIFIIYESFWIYFYNPDSIDVSKIKI